MASQNRISTGDDRILHAQRVCIQSGSAVVVFWKRERYRATLGCGEGPASLECEGPCRQRYGDCVQPGWEPPRFGRFAQTWRARGQATARLGRTDRQDI